MTAPPMDNSTGIHLKAGLNALGLLSPRESLEPRSGK